MNKRQAYWALYLPRFDFTLKHVLGTNMEKADRLSKRLDWKVGVEKDNVNQTLIKEKWICGLAEVVIEGPEIDILEKVKIARRKDKEVIKVVEEIKKTGVETLRGNEWQVEWELVLKEENLYVLKNKELRVKIIWLYHNVLTAGHAGW